MSRNQKYLSCFLFAVLEGVSLFSQFNIDSLRNIIATSKDEEVLAYTYNDYAFQFYLSQPDTAILYAEKALELAQKLNLTTQIYSAYNVLGLTYQIKGLYQLSIEYFNKQFPYFKEDNADKAKVYYNMSLTYRYMQNDKAALEAQLKAMYIFEKTKDSVLLGSICQSLANIYRDLADYNLSEEYILRAFDIFNSVSDVGIYSREKLTGHVYNSYGNLMQVKGDLQRAIQYHEKANVLYDEAGDYFNKAVSHENLGDDYTLLEKYPEAIKQYSVSREIMRQLNSLTDVGHSNSNIANVYFQTGDYMQALQFADSALASFSITGADASMKDTYELKYKIFDAVGNADSALAFYKKFNALEDSLNVESQKAEALRLKEEFETTQKEQQIVLLETSNTLKDKEKQQQIIFRNIAIAVIGLLLLLGFLIWNRNRIKQQVKQLQMRNNIAIDLHDEVGSSLSSIKMLSEIATLQKEDKHQLDEILKKINTNARETAEKMHDIIWMINPKHDQLENILQRMEKFLFEMCAPKNIQFELKREIDETLKLNMQQRKDMLLIFKEAVHNAVKYANAKKITATISRQNQQIILSIQDDGNGFDIYTIQPGNGLDSMRMRTEGLKGSLKIISSENTGTEISLSIPV